MTDREQTRRDVADPFSDDVLQRLVASNRDYQNAHGHYIVPLAARLLTVRAELEQAERKITQLETQLSRAHEDESIEREKREQAEQLLVRERVRMHEQKQRAEQAERELARTKRSLDAARATCFACSEARERMHAAEDRAEQAEEDLRIERGDHAVTAERKRQAERELAELKAGLR